MYEYELEEKRLAQELAEHQRKMQAVIDRMKALQKKVEAETDKENRETMKMYSTMESIATVEDRIMLIDSKIAELREHTKYL